MRLLLLERFSLAPSLFVLLLATPAYFFAYQATPSLHFGIGRWDGAFLAGADQFYSPTRMSGPVRLADNSVHVEEFVGRLTKRRAGFHLPYHALRSALVLRLRCHRFGLQGTVTLTVNDQTIDDFVFTRESYPWGGIRAVISQEIAEGGPLRIDLSVKGGDTPPAHLPADLGLGVDWIEVTPVSGGVLLLPTTGQWIGLLALFAAGYVFLRFLGARAWQTAFVLLGLSVLLSLAVVLQPETVSRALVSAWLGFPSLMLLVVSGEFIDRWTSEPRAK